MTHTAIVLNGHIVPTFLHVSSNIQPTGMATSNIIANTCLKQTCPSNAIYGAYTNKLMCTYQTHYVSIYISYELLQ